MSNRIVSAASVSILMYRHARSLFLRVDFTSLDCNAANTEFRYDRCQIN